jgi:hypothetical protein
MFSARPPHQAALPPSTLPNAKTPPADPVFLGIIHCRHLFIYDHTFLAPTRNETSLTAIYFAAPLRE